MKGEQEVRALGEGWQGLLFTALLGGRASPKQPPARPALGETAEVHLAPKEILTEQGWPSTPPES